MDVNFVKDLRKVMNNNKKYKENYDTNINNFEKIYEIINYYNPQYYSYKEIIIDSERRLKFLNNAIDIVITNENIGENIRDILIQMIDKLYNCLYRESDLVEIEIPSDLKDNLFNNNLLISTSELLFLTTILKENKEIYETDFKNKNFSQTIKEGLHTGITKLLRIDKKNLSHLLGVTNDGSLYEFYRKVFVNNKIKEIINSLDNKDVTNNNFNMEEFNQKFKDFFGLDFNHTNYKKIINWRYNAKEDYLKKKDIIVTEEEKEKLNKTCDYVPKSKAIDFYCDENSIKLLCYENERINKFIIKYVRNSIIKKQNNNSKELKEIFKDDELKLLLDKNIKSDETIKNLVNKYIKQKKYKFEKEKEFKKSFMNKFGYSYPLINYNELLTKNISFYNFSLFKNLNSIIVDYESTGKKIDSNVFLVSYNRMKRKKAKLKTKEIIIERDKKYEEAAFEDLVDDSLDKNYIMNLKSLLSFPIEDRYYFKFGFTKKDKIKQDDKLIEDNTSKNSNITLIGFKTSSEEEQERLNNLQTNGHIEHKLTCETNLSSNYHQYVTDFIRFGREYPIDLIVEEGVNKYNKTFKIKFIPPQSPSANIRKYIDLFNEYQYNKNNNYEESFIYEKSLIEKIKKLLYSHISTKEMEIKIMEYKLKKNKIDNYKINYYENNIKNNIKKLNELKTYYEEVTRYFSNYEDYIYKKIRNKEVESNIELKEDYDKDKRKKF